MNKSLLLIFILLHACAFAHTPHYTSGIGVRFGKFNNGISYKNFIFGDNRSGIQLDGYYTHIADGGYSLKGFLIRQVAFKIPIVQIPLDFVIGGGIHAAYFPNKDHVYYKRKNKTANYYTNDNIISAGVDVTIQIEYRIQKKKIPITIGVEAVPFYDFINPGPEFADVGIAIRYIFR